MGIPYLLNQPWKAWTRDERFFCSILYSHAIQDVAGFANWLVETAGIDIPAQNNWDLGYEVCFYRDYMWQVGENTAAQEGLPRKRTYDLCVFGDSVMIIIEAKVCDRFSTLQNTWFQQDKTHLQKMLGSCCPDVRVVALASSRYFPRARRPTIDWLDGFVTWSDVAEYFDEALLRQADAMYGMRPRQFFAEL